jgi:predicted alpha/beta-hydrolase family hydrolase
MAPAEPRSFAVDAGGGQTTALFYPAEGKARAAIVLAHGAGAPQTHPWMVAMARGLTARAIDVVTFNFLYAERKRRMVDRPPVLEATWRAVVLAVRARDDVAVGRLFAGGKSMGGRIATQVAAQEGAAWPVAGLVLLGYPLHPPGKPETLRAAHLPAVRVPMLFVQGERDTFGTRDELAPIVERLKGGAPGTRLYVVEGGDHSLATRRGRAAGGDATFTAVVDEVSRFIA